MNNNLQDKHNVYTLFKFILMYTLMANFIKIKSLKLLYFSILYLNNLDSYWAC